MNRTTLGKLVKQVPSNTQHIGYTLPLQKESKDLAVIVVRSLEGRFFTKHSLDFPVTELHVDNCPFKSARSHFYKTYKTNLTCWERILIIKDNNCLLHVMIATMIEGSKAPINMIPVARHLLLPLGLTGIILPFALQSRKIVLPTYIEFSRDPLTIKGAVKDRDPVDLQRVVKRRERGASNSHKRKTYKELEVE